MSDMTLFEGGNSLVSSDLFKSLQDVDDNLSGGSGGNQNLVLVSSGVNSLNSKLNELTTRLSFAEENLRSFENYRKSLNQTLIEIQASINSADKSLEAEVHESAMDNL